jgi:hypothetical protein
MSEATIIRIGGDRAGDWVMFDLADMLLIQPFTWYVKRRKKLRYAQAFDENGRTILMHRLIMGAAAGTVIGTAAAMLKAREPSEEAVCV